MSKDTEYGPLEEGVSMTQETSRRNRKNRDVPGHGWYKHPVSGARAIVQDDPLWGNTQAQAFTQVGFVYERPATEDEITTLPELASDARKVEEGNLKGLSARLDKLETVAEDNKALTSEVEQLRKDLEAANKAREEAEKAAEKSAADASKHIADAGKAPQGSTAQEASANQAKNAALDVQSEREQASGQSQNATLKTPEQDAQSRSDEEVEAKLDAEKTGSDKTKEKGNGK